MKIIKLININKLAQKNRKNHKKSVKKLDIQKG